MNVLLAGGGGLIGTALADHLRAGGGRVTRLRRGRGDGPARHDEVSWDPIRGTVDVERLDEAGPFAGVVNLAGAGIGDRRWSPSRKELIIESRIGSTQLLVGTLAQLSTRPAVLVSASAVGFYGDRGDEVLTEGSPAGTGFLADLCQAWEKATGPAGPAGTRTVLLRSGIVLARAGG
ncbi:MAG: NAD-dependent epimerase/dehydratase family protein, partial [Acidimicrobiales bacterium]